MHRLKTSLVELSATEPTGGSLGLRSSRPAWTYSKNLALKEIVHVRVCGGGGGARAKHGPPPLGPVGKHGP